MAGLRSVMLPGKPNVLLVNEGLETEQLAFTLGREVGYQVMRLQNRPLVSSVIEAESFDQVLNNFKASYFAGAILIPKGELIRGIEQFFSRPVWEPTALLTLMDSFQATPEVFLHRLSNIMPGHFGINQPFFLRFDNKMGENNFQLTKEMHLAKLHNPHGIISEHFYRRCVSVTILQELAEKQYSGSWDGRTLCRAQIAEYMDTGSRYLILSLAKPSPPKGHNSSVSLGFAVDEALRSRVRFLNDTQLMHRLVNETCERCGALNCLERSHPPVIWNRLRRNDALKETLRKLKTEAK